MPAHLGGHMINRWRIGALIAILLTFTSPTTVAAWGGKPTDSVHEGLDCTLQVTARRAQVSGVLQCEKKFNLWSDDHVSLRSDQFSADYLGVSSVSFRMRPSIATMRPAHPVLSCLGTWDRHSFSGALVIRNDLAVKCTGANHADIACTSLHPNGIRGSGSIDAECYRMEFFDGKEWKY